MAAGNGAPVLSLTAAREQRVHRGLLEKLSTYMGEEISEAEVVWALTRFYAEELEEDIELDNLGVALDWLIFRHRWDDGRTLCERLAASGADISSLEQGMLQKWTQATAGCFRIDLATSQQLELSRLPDGRRFTVRAAGSQMRAGQLISTWLLPATGSYNFGFCTYEIPGDNLTSLVHLLGVELSLLRRQYAAATWDDLFNGYWPRINDVLTICALMKADALRIEAPGGLAAVSGGKAPAAVGRGWQRVAKLIVNWLSSEGADESEVAGALRLWWDFAQTTQPRVGKAGVWAAATLYLHRVAVHRDDLISQADLAGDLEVSIGSVGARSREISRTLNIEPWDGRYVDLLDPVYRYMWFHRCLQAATPLPRLVTWGNNQ